MTSFVGLISVVFDGVLTMATATSAVAVHLLKGLVIVLLLLAIVEFLRCFLRFILQLIILAISVALAVVVYASTFFVHVATIMLTDPLEKAVAWQQRTMLFMNSYLPVEY